ncbi:hypothetical protein J6590_008587 [Homalodisca vitripennis]|nr:hypothetical protein J6590_008587 [Homalodisca vitripennis]
MDHSRQGVRDDSRLPASEEDRAKCSPGVDPIVYRTYGTPLTTGTPNGNGRSKPSRGIQAISLRLVPR